MEDRTVTYSRRRLYEEVWAEPVQMVAKRYGVSGVALAKPVVASAFPCHPAATGPSCKPVLHPGSLPCLL